MCTLLDINPYLGLFHTPSEEITFQKALLGEIFHSFIPATFLVTFCRSLFNKKMKQEYRTLNRPINTNRAQPMDRGIYPSVATDLLGNDVRGMVAQPMPTYSVFVADDAELLNDVNNSVASNNTNPL